MNNRNMNNMNENMMNMMMQMMMNNNNNGNNMGMNNMNQNPMMNMFQQMMMNCNMGNNMNNMQTGNMNMQNMPMGNNNNVEWTLTFSKNGVKVLIQIDPEKLISEAISKYKIESLDTTSCIFKFNNKELCQTLKISQSGLKNGSEIIVESNFSNFGGLNLIFVKKNEGKRVTVQVNWEDTVNEAITKYRNKAGDTNPSIFIFNGKALDNNLKLNQVSIRNNSEILVISLVNLEGA